MELAQRLLSTRRGSTILGILAAALAGILLLVYISQYRNSVSSSNKAVQVVVAKALIPKGTPGDVVRTQGLFQTTSVARDQLRDGAFVDVSGLTGRVATADIFPGQQLTGAEFSVATSTTISTKLSGDLRAVSVPVDSARGLVGQVEAGDHVDVLASWTPQNSPNGPVVREIMHNALVLRGPGAPTGGGLTSAGASNIVLRAKAHEAAQFAWASDNGRVWVVLRPSANASNPKPPFITSDTLLRGAK
jgi:Flp pilus assembly protein CpaB